MSEAIKVQLGHSTVFLLNENSEYKKNVEKYLFNNCLGSNRDNFFVGPQPVSIEKKDILNKIFSMEYHVCEKSDGERMYLWITKINGKHAIFLVTRGLKFYITPFKFNEECFEGSIFDGEFIQRTDGKYYFVIHDCWMYCGTDYRREKYHVKRWHCIKDFLDRRVISSPSDCCYLIHKVFYQVGNKLHVTWEHINKTKLNNIDGLIFTPAVGEWTFGRDWNLLKWKSDGMHTVDFQIKNLVRKIELQIIDSQSNLVVVDTITSKHESWKPIKDFILVNCPEDKTPIIEFLIEKKIDEDGWKYTPYRLRDDKNIPNGKITWENTLKNITENLKIENFVNIYESEKENVDTIDLNRMNLS